MRRKNNSLSLWILVPVFALLTVSGGCKKEEVPPPQPSPAGAPAPQAKPPIQKQASSARPAVTTSSQLDFTSRKDPFKPFIEPKSVAKVAPALRGRRVGGLLPIQSYAVEQFKVSGIIVGLRENRALIIDPAGKGYVVKVGMSIGNNNGVITRIAPSYIEVSERFRAENGKMTKRTVKLSLSKKL